ncbi:MAG TPA: hypothetical protein VK753_03125 [Xanthomonadaceae bacterium]|jgi:hypothetical protein|nr:hypothetical protein [Xanthomonadaceae bacterium]
MQTVPMAMRQLMAESECHPSGSLEHCLAYPEMAGIPPAFNRMAQADFLVRLEAEPGLEWDDYCPAYALGLLTYAAYARNPQALSSGEVEAQWDELCGISRLPWEQARSVIERAWEAWQHLRAHEENSGHPF